MLYVFNRNNQIHIAWNGKDNAKTFKTGNAGCALVVTNVRTRLAG